MPAIECDAQKIFHGVSGVSSIRKQQWPCVSRARGSTTVGLQYYQSLHDQKCLAGQDVEAALFTSLLPKQDVENFEEVSEFLSVLSTVDRLYTYLSFLPVAMRA